MFPEGPLPVSAFPPLMRNACGGVSCFAQPGAGLLTLVRRVGPVCSGQLWRSGGPDKLEQVQVSQKGQCAARRFPHPGSACSLHTQIIAIIRKANNHEQRSKRPRRGRMFQRKRFRKRPEEENLEDFMTVSLVVRVSERIFMKPCLCHHIFLNNQQNV